MKQSDILRTMKLFNSSDIVRRYSFKTDSKRGYYAFFQLKDCFECLSPHKLAV
ncbi:hypothetical protein SDC9_119570 [bioreactor metagenome]|uniref:Uncharacterized protein n=1 Tax=bioreactor metagenome TaxID=1076179 RepID=A0A645C9H3_9ZZZZ